MKKIAICGLAVGAVVGVVGIVGVVGWATGKPNGIRVSEGSKYQYQVIDPEDIYVEYSGLKRDVKLSEYKGKYVTDTSVYLSDEVGIYLDDKHFTADVDDFVKYSDINWSWSVSNYELYNLASSQDGEVSSSLFEGTVTYTDGTEGSIDADSVSLDLSSGYMTVSIKFRDSTFPYRVEVAEAWDTDGDVDDTSFAVTNLSVSYDDWSVTPYDASGLSFYEQFCLMEDIVACFNSSTTSQVVTAKQKYLDDPDKYENTDIPYEVTVREDSEWQSRYGNSTIQEVYRAYGLPDYGETAVCEHQTPSEVRESFKEYFNTQEMSSLIMPIFSAYCPFSSHRFYSMSMEEIRDYVVAYIAYLNNTNLNDKSLWANDYILSLYDLSCDNIISKFSNYLHNLDIYDVLSYYTNAVDTIGYSGTIIDWLSQSGDEFDKNCFDMLYTDFEGMNWQNVDYDATELLRSKGYSIPDYVTYADDENGESTSDVLFEMETLSH